MTRTTFFFKVVVEHDDRELPDKLAQEIRGRLERLYGVHHVELALITRENE